MVTIHGVEIKQLRTFPDQRGFFREVIRVTDEFFADVRTKLRPGGILLTVLIGLGWFILMVIRTPGLLSWTSLPRFLHPMNWRSCFR